MWLLLLPSVCTQVHFNFCLYPQCGLGAEANVRFAVPRYEGVSLSPKVAAES
jgi:hypothetical protein